MINEAILNKIKSGATVRVFEIIRDGDKEQIRRFEGLVLARKHGSEAGATFTVRSTVAGVGVEKVFPIHSPMVDRVEILSSPSKVRRAKIYFTRTLSRKAIRRKTVIKDDKDLVALPDAQIDENLGKDIAEEKAKVDEAQKEMKEQAKEEREESSSAKASKDKEEKVGRKAGDEEKEEKIEKKEEKTEAEKEESQGSPVERDSLKPGASREDKKKEEKTAE